MRICNSLEEFPFFLASWSLSVSVCLSLSLSRSLHVCRSLSACLSSHRAGSLPLFVWTLSVVWTMSARTLFVLYLDHVCCGPSLLISDAKIRRRKKLSAHLFVCVSSRTRALNELSIPIPFICTALGVPQDRPGPVGQLPDILQTDRTRRRDRGRRGRLQSQHVK